MIDFESYEFITNAVLNKEYDKALKMLEPFRYSIFNYIIKFPNIYPTSQVLKKLNFLLKSGGEDSCTFIQNVYCKKEFEEIKSDIDYCILVLMDRYKDTGRHFLVYLCASFPYEYVRLIHYSLKDILNNENQKYTIDITDSHLQDYKANIEENFVDSGIFDGYVDIDNNLNEFWYLNDIDELSTFSKLNNEERQILFLYYIREISDSIIAHMLSRHVNTINKKKLCSIKRISKNNIVARTRRVI